MNNPEESKVLQSSVESVANTAQGAFAATADAETAMDALDAFEDDLDASDDDLESPASDERYEHWRLVADKGQQLLRVDKFIINLIHDVSRNRVQQAADAGAIYANGGLIVDSVFTNNYAGSSTGDGGAVYIDDIGTNQKVLFSNCYAVHCTAAGDGGFMYINDSERNPNYYIKKLNLDAQTNAIIDELLFIREFSLKQISLP